MTVQVGSASSLSGSIANVFVRWNDTSNVLEEAVVPDHTSMIRHLSTTTGRGSVHIAEDSLRALYPIAEQATIVNTAVIGSGKPSSHFKIHIKRLEKVIERAKHRHDKAAAGPHRMCRQMRHSVLAKDDRDTRFNSHGAKLNCNVRRVGKRGGDRKRAVRARIGSGEPD
jgi:hypothetical protein